jgi:hypothetical protein
MISLRWSFESIFEGRSDDRWGRIGSHHDFPDLDGKHECRATCLDLLVTMYCGNYIIKRKSSSNGKATYTGDCGVDALTAVFCQKAEALGDARGGSHTMTYGLAVQKAPVAGNGFQGMPNCVTEVQDLSEATLTFVAFDNPGF